MSKKLTTLEGNTIEIFEPENSGTEMRPGHCPGCDEQTAGYTGRCAAIRTVEPGGTVVSGSNYGHYNCVSQMYETMLQDAVSIHVPNTVPEELQWYEGTQQQFILFLRDNQGSNIICDFEYSRHKACRYRWRREDNL